MSVDTQVLAAISDFEAAVKKQSHARKPSAHELRAVAKVAAWDLVRLVPTLGRAHGVEVVEQLFLDAVTA